MTYGEWVRSVDPAELTRSERRLLVEERAWARENARLVHGLDAMVGREYQLATTMATVAHEAGVENEPHWWSAGTRLRILARVGSSLLGEVQSRYGLVLLVQAHWLRAATP